MAEATDNTSALTRCDAADQRCCQPTQRARDCSLLLHAWHVGERKLCGVVCAVVDCVLNWEMQLRSDRATARIPGFGLI